MENHHFQWELPEANPLGLLPSLRTGGLLVPIVPPLLLTPALLLPSLQGLGAAREETVQLEEGDVRQIKPGFVFPMVLVPGK